ncbi:hypothetical protein JAAARDRAFT_194424 [Jaapia argillacea MUCL 33604]|uniref:Ubiquitin-like domain-containing protein n=1 Tax=Jaapia argillacea MUCL 33604 TaxID=933084 RepID=A0A067PR78_9AGAM|nr:hypothetical protein JAAARDRAFT_194424 [Jaapia argillacea MUCL 33604]
MPSRPHVSSPQPTTNNVVGTAFDARAHNIDCFCFTAISSDKQTILHLQAAPTDTVQFVRLAISFFAGIPLDGVHLNHHGKQLVEVDETLESCDIKVDSVVEFEVPRGPLPRSVPTVSGEWVPFIRGSPQTTSPNQSEVSILAPKEARKGSSLSHVLQASLPPKDDTRVGEGDLPLPEVWPTQVERAQSALDFGFRL